MALRARVSAPLPIYLGGPAGPVGGQGERGYTGAPGQTGPTGRGIASAAIVAGHLVLTYTDGASVDAGYVRGGLGTVNGKGPDGNGALTLTPADLGAQPVSYIMPEMFGAIGDGATNDRAAVQAALNYLGTKANQFNCQTLFLYNSYAIGGTGALTVPDWVNVASLARFHGADGRSQPRLIFSDASGYVLLGRACTLSGIQVTTAAACPYPAILYTGQFGLFNVITAGGVASLGPTFVLTPAAQDLYVNTINPSVTGGLTDGVYTNVQFSQYAGNDGAARLKVTVSGGKLTGVSCTTGGNIGRACIMADLAANALYPGSPAIARAFQIFTCQAGRSRVDGLFANTHKGDARPVVDIETGLDFGDFSDIHVWNGLVNQSGLGGTGIRVGKWDGLAINSPKVFGYNIGYDWSCCEQGHYAFATCAEQQMDYCNVGHKISGPFRIDFTGGYLQTTGRCFELSHDLLNVNFTALSIEATGDSAIIALSWNLLGVAGCNFIHRDGVSSSIPRIALATGNGACIHNISGNTFDGRTPAISTSCFKAGSIGQNAWPGRQYPATDGQGNPTPGYLTKSQNAYSSIAPTFSGTFLASTDASGMYTFAHNQGYAPILADVSPVGASAYYFQTAVVASDTESITILATKINQSDATQNGRIAPNTLINCAYLM